MKNGCRFGTHRVLNETGVFPQAAKKLDNTMVLYNNEILVQVKTLKLDSASFNQLKNQSNGKKEIMENIIKEIVNNRGKMHNPITKSGGVFYGIVKEIGKDIKDNLQINDRIVSLVSLSLIPLKIYNIKDINFQTEEIVIDGEAILFETSKYAKYEDQIPLNEFISILDVAGAPARTREIVKKGDTVTIIGSGGNAGLLCLYEARKKVGKEGNIISFAYNDKDVEIITKTKLATHIIKVDATKPLDVYREIKQVSSFADVTINCANVPGTEMASILATKEKGIVYFFNMTTDFSASALGAEGIGKDITMLIGNGYLENHYQIAIDSYMNLKDILT